MVHCTDIAGSVGCSIGQVKPGDERICCHAPNEALSEKSCLPRFAADGCFDGNGCRHPLMKQAPSVHPIDAARLCLIRFGPIERRPDEARTSRAATTTRFN
jgi:hypothetical protein